MNARSERALEHARDDLDPRVDVDDLRARELAPAEREQLAGQRAGAGDCGLDAFELGDRVRIVERVGGELDAHADRAQQVVEVVRDAGGESTERFEPVGTLQALLECGALCRGALALRDVADDLDDVGITVAVDGGRGDLDRHRGAIGAQIAANQHAVAHHGLGVGGDERSDGGADQLVARASVQSLGSGVRFLDRARRCITDDDRIRVGFEQLSIGIE